MKPHPKMVVTCGLQTRISYASPPKGIKKGPSERGPERLKRNAPKGYGWDGDIGTERSGCHRITQAAPHPLPDGVRPTGRAPWATGRRPPSAGTACSTRRRSATTATWRTATAATTGAGRRRTGGAPGTSGAGQGPPVVGAPAGPFPSAHHPRRMGSPAAAPRAPIWARATCPAKMALVPTSRTALRSACAVAGGPGSGQVSSIFGILRNGSELSPPPPAYPTSCPGADELSNRCRHVRLRLLPGTVHRGGWAAVHLLHPVPHAHGNCNGKSDLSHHPHRHPFAIFNGLPRANHIAKHGAIFVQPDTYQLCWTAHLALQ